MSTVADPAPLTFAPTGQSPPLAATPPEPSPGLEPQLGMRSRSPIIDVTTIAALTLCAVYGFANAYGGWRYLLAGGIGVALGSAAAWIGASRRQPLLVVVAVTLVGFVLLGAVAAVPARSLFGVLPTPGTVADLFDGAIAGWRRLLTVEPPAGSGSNLLVVPYLCGTVSTVVGSSIALRTRRPQFAVVPPIGLLVLSILFGTAEPASVLVQGTLFAVLTIWWLAESQHQARLVAKGSRSTRRWISAFAMLLVAAVAGTWLAPDTADRFVLRDETEPPFTPADYPSPLNGYRNFTDGAPVEQSDAAAPDSELLSARGWNTVELFEVSGLPDEQRLRLATLDTYDGVVYQVGSGNQSSGYFRKINETVPKGPGNRGDRDARTVDIEVLEVPDSNQPYDDIWVPLPDGVRTIRFQGDDADTLAESLRYNLATGTAAVPDRISAGDRYELQVVTPDLPPVESLETAAAGKKTPAPYQVNGLADVARQFSGEVDCAAATPESPEQDPAAGDAVADTDTGSTPQAQSPYEKAVTIATNLKKCGGLSDGKDSTLPGHGAFRLERMVAPGAPEMVGNGEQFAPLAALMSQQLGVPTRVVMGFRSKEESDRWRKDNPKGGIEPNGDTYRVVGADVAAWIEVSLAGVGWVPIKDVTPTKEQPLVRPAPQPLSPTNEPPPPPPSLPNSEEDPADAGRVDPPPPPPPEPPAFPWWIFKWIGVALSPVLVLGAITALIAGVKSRRRTRRRSRGTPDARIDGGWAEIADLARDMGSPLPARSTRREAAALSSHPALRPFAASTDLVVFGPGDMTDEQVERYWDEVEATRSGLVAGMSRFARWRVLVSLASFRSSIDRWLAARSTERRRRAMTVTAARTSQVRSTIGAGR